MKYGFNSWNSWDKLKKCLVGNVYPQGFFEPYYDNRVSDALSKVNEESREDINGLSNILESAGVEVIRTPSEVLLQNKPVKDVNEYIELSKGRISKPLLAPRDEFIVFGDTLVNTFNDIIRPTTYKEISSICLSDSERYVYPKYPNCDRGRCGWAPCADDASFVKLLIDNFKGSYKIRNVYMIGNSSGGTFVNSYVCKYPESITSAISINGMSRLGFGCTPNQPVNFITYASLKDTSVPPVGGISADGLFYVHCHVASGHENPEHASTRR